MKITFWYKNKNLLILRKKVEKIILQKKIKIFFIVSPIFCMKKWWNRHFHLIDELSTVADCGIVSVFPLAILFSALDWKL